MDRPSRRCVFVFIALALVFLPAVAGLADAGVKQGSAERFVTTYPGVVLTIVGVLFSIVGCLLMSAAIDFKKSVVENKRNMDMQHVEMTKAVEKFESTVATLFEQDRDIREEMAEVKTDVAAQKATCKTNRENCHAYRGQGQSRTSTKETVDCKN